MVTIITAMLNISTLFDKAFAAHQASKLDEAQSLYLQIISAMPNHADALHLLGLIAASNGKAQQAMDWIEKAIAANSSDPSYYNNLATLYKNLGNDTRAAALYQQALALKTDYAEAHYNYANLLQRVNDKNSAVYHYQQALKSNAHYAQAHNNLGVLLQELGQMQEAKAHLQQAVVLQPHYAEAHYNLANWYKENQEANNSAQHYMQALNLQPNLADAHYGIGVLLLEQHKWQEAITCFSRAIHLNPHFAKAYYHAALAFRALEQWQEMRRHLEQYLVLDTEDTLGAGLLLAAANNNVPQRAQDAHMQALYAQRAAKWDGVAARDNPYRGHVLVADACNTYVSSTAATILDLGCGTGLVVDVLARDAQYLTGVDLSADMLAQARRKGKYSALYQQEIVSYLAQEQQRFDAVLSAATLIHLGDLAPVFRSVYEHLQEHGVFIFTVFPAQQKDNFGLCEQAELAQGGCFSHGEDYIRATAHEAGFSVACIREEIHEHNKGVPMQCLLVVLKRV